MVTPLDIYVVIDFGGICDTLIKSIINSNPNFNILLRAENLLAHLYHRIGRLGEIEVKVNRDINDSCLEQFSR